MSNEKTLLDDIIYRAKEDPNMLKSLHRNLQSSKKSQREMGICFLGHDHCSKTTNENQMILKPF